MARTIVRKLFATSAGNGIATITLSQAGRITAVGWDCTGIAGANVTGGETVELSLNTATSQIATNDTVTSISSASITNNIASSICDTQHFVAGMSIPIQSGDRLVLNSTTVGGNAMASRTFTCFVYIEQGS